MTTTQLRWLATSQIFLMYDNMTKEDFQNVAITSGAMTQPFAANADNVLCIDVLLPSAVPSCDFVILPILQVCGRLHQTILTTMWQPTSRIHWNPQKLPSQSSIRLSKRRFMPCPSSAINRRMHSGCSPSISRTLQLTNVPISRKKFQNMSSFVFLSRESLAFGRFWSWLCFLRLVLLKLDNFGPFCPGLAPCVVR